MRAQPSSLDLWHIYLVSLELGAEPERRHSLMIRLGDVKSLTGKWAEAETIYQEALALAGGFGD